VNICSKVGEAWQALCEKRNIELRSRNHCCCGKAIRTTYSEYVTVALVIQHANRVRRIMSSSVACLNLKYFSTLSHKRYDFRGGGKVLNTKRVFWFSVQILSETFLIVRRIEWDMILICVDLGGRRIIKKKNESHWEHGCLSVVSVVCCQIEASATGWSLVLLNVACRCVWSRNLENEEAKARYWAVKIQAQWVVTPRKQQQQHDLNLRWSPCRVPLFLSDFMENWIFTTFSESRVVPREQTDR
jgi:hypothetical protein